MENQGQTGNFVSERLKSWMGMSVAGTVSIRSAGIPWKRVPGNKETLLRDVEEWGEEERLAGFLR